MSESERDVLIFERRQYTLRPGRYNDFWDAQRTWNVSEPSAELLSANLSYFGSVAGAIGQVVHIYRFDSVDHWRHTYLRYYAEQMPEYFTTVRPWVLAQETALLTAPPVEGPADLWLGERPVLPSTVATAVSSSGSDVVVIEEAVDFLPGSLATYWPAYSAYREADRSEAENCLGVLVTLVGQLHRVYTYYAFADAELARIHMEARRVDQTWRTFTEKYQDLVSGSHVLLLQPSPVPELRSLFEPTGPAGPIPGVAS